MKDMIFEQSEFQKHQELFPQNLAQSCLSSMSYQAQDILYTALKQLQAVIGIERKDKKSTLNLIMDLEFTRYANIRSEEKLWQVFHLLKYSMNDLILICNEKGYMTGTYIDVNIQLSKLVQELAA